MRKVLSLAGVLIIAFSLFTGTAWAALSQTEISQLYISIFGRASEGEGNAYWQSNQSDMVTAANTMLATAPAKSYFGATLNDNQRLIEFIYENTLGKTYAEDPAGVDYWVGELKNGQSKGQVIATMISAVMDPAYSGFAAQDQFINKVAVCNYTADTIETVVDANDLSEFVSLLSGVTDKPETVTAAEAGVGTLRKSMLDVQFPLLKFNYNEDAGSVRVLTSKTVNSYEEVQAKLSAEVNGDSASFNNISEKFIDELLEKSSSLDSMPSYAPRGESKQLIVDVSDGKIDYSGYLLKADINSDSKVDFDDLEALKAGLFLGLSDAKYDVNSDNTVDARDMIFLLARIGTEVNYFDFYTTSGEKIPDLPLREATDGRVLDYTGAEAQVMVVPKDINKVSGFLTGLSDIDEVWYKKTGWVYQDDAVQRKVIGDGDAGVSKGKIIKEALEELLEFDKVKNEPHLVGWHLNVRYVDVGKYKDLDIYGMDGSVSYIQPFEDRIRNPYFAKTTMNHDKRAVTKIAYALHLGAETPWVDVKLVRKPIKATLYRDGEKVFVHQIIHASTNIFTSREDRVLSADIWSDNNNLEGKVNLYRIGPYPEERDFGSVELENAGFSAPDLPYGAYKIDYENNCGCTTRLEEEFLFVDEDRYIFELKEAEKKVAVGLTILAQVGDGVEPLKNEPVTLKSADCVSEAKSAGGTTNEVGFVAFDAMPIGKYDVYVGSKKSGSVTFCDTYDGSVTVPATEHLWKFKVVYHNPDYGSGTITATDIKIDFNAEADPGGIKFYAVASSTCGGALYGCGSFYIFNDTIVKPGSKWVSFESNIPIHPEAGIIGQMISAEIDYGMNGLVCDGHIPEGFGPDSGTTNWTYTNGYSTWNLTLEPCDTGGCD